MWTLAITLVWFFASHVAGEKCCRTNQIVSFPNPKVTHFQGFCQPTQRLGIHNDVMEYDCGEFGFVEYHAGSPIAGGKTSNAVVGIKRSEHRPYVQVVLHCDPAENPGLKENFAIGGAAFYCSTIMGTTFHHFTGCKKPRVSYYLARVEENIVCVAGHA